MLAPDSDKMPAPALLKVKFVPLMMPVMLASPLLVTDKALLLAKPMAAAVKVAVLMVRPVSVLPTVLPTVLPKVVLPVVVVDRVLAPLTVLLKVMAPPLLPVVSVVAAPKVTAPV